MGAADDFGAVDLGGPVAFGKLGACPVAFGKLGAGPVAFGKLGAGPVAFGKLGAGPVAFGKLGAGPVVFGSWGDLGADLGGSAEGGGPAAFGWGDLGASAEGGDLGGAEAGGPGGDLGGSAEAGGPAAFALLGGPSPSPETAPPRWPHWAPLHRPDSACQHFPTPWASTKLRPCPSAQSQCQHHPGMKAVL